MKIGIIILGLCLFAIIIWLFFLDDPDNFEPIPVEQTNGPTPPRPGKAISLPRQFRRHQNYLIRQKSLISSNLKEMYHQQQVLDISTQLNRLGAEENKINDAIINLKQHDLDLSSREIELMLKQREGLLQINEARYKHKLETINSIKLKAENDIEKGLLQIENSKLDLRVNKLELDEYGNQLIHKDRLQELKEIDLQLTNKSLDNKMGQIRNQMDELTLRARSNEISFEDHLNKLNAHEVKLKKMELGNIKDGIVNLKSEVELSKIDAQLMVREGMVTLKNQDLLNKKNTIGNLIDKMSNKEEKIKIAEQSLKLTYAIASEKYKSLLNEILYQSKNLKLERKANSLSAKQEQLKLYENRLNNLSQYINQMYEVKSEWNRIESKENNIDFRENQLRLDRKYQRTQEALGYLRLYRHENDIRFREQRFEIKKMLESMNSWW